MKKLIKILLKFVATLFGNLDAERQKLIELAIGVGNAIKKVLDREVDDVAVDIVGLLNPSLAKTLGNAKDKLQEMLPDLILKLSLMKDIPGYTKNEQVKYVLELLKGSDRS